MRVICLDFETYFDKEYSLKKMTTEAYVRDPRFEAHGCAVFTHDAATGEMYSTWWSPDELRIAITAWKSQRQQGHQICLLAHHAHFDGLILSHHFDYCPDYWLDTLSMGRVCFDGTVSLSLDSLAKRFGLMPKSVPYSLFKGHYWHELSPQIQDAVKRGAMHDCALEWTCAKYMLAGHPRYVPYPFPQSELDVIDLTIRMFTEPVLVGNMELLTEAWTVEEQDRQALFERLGTTADQLRKDAVFAEMLEELGIEPEWKTTAKGNDKYAFAKSDPFIQELLESEDQDIALLVEARLKAHSSIYQTRVERLGFMATRGPMCVYLAFAAAHTRRWGGGDKTNFQNFPRSDPYNPKKGALRRAIKAP